MKLPRPVTLATNLASAGTLAWLYGGDLLDYRRARTAEVSAMTQLPNAPLALAALAVGVLCLGVAAFGVLRSRPEGFRGYRLLPICLVVFLFVDLFVLGASRVANLPSADRLSAAAQLLAVQAQERSTQAAVLTDARSLEELTAQLGEPPYLMRGARVPHYSLQMQRNCDGPARRAPGAAVGTLIYCLAPAGDRAWITAVGLPLEERFGAPQVLSSNGAPRWWPVQALPEPDLPDAGG